MPASYNKMVSVIVPAYNCSHTIEKCINSILAQDYEKFGVIVLYDGSDDDTELVLRRIGNVSGKIRYFRLCHRGVSLVRNEGLKYARGEYLMFVDADEYVRHDYISRMVSAMEESPDRDMCICSYERVVYDRLYPVMRLLKPGVISKEEYLTNTLKDPGHHYFGVLWNKIFKRSIVEKYKIIFQEDISLGEDFVFSLNYLRHVRKINVIKDRLYYYCYQRQGSSLSRISDKSISDCIKEMRSRNIIFKVYTDEFKLENMYKAKKRQLYHYWVVFYLRQKYSIKNEYRWSNEEKMRWEKLMYENSNITSALKTYGTDALNFKYMQYYLYQSIKDTAKRLIRFVNNKLGCEEKNEVQKIPE